ncbi:hypothetical protein PLICRDRAFT_170481 [Plicaturopsis crispa FD-325 SS-3]|nr:hypothetical protein PLICRDRAFT_170481 [Plicaturopsis crispa FD-325 SS-3]
MAAYSPYSAASSLAHPTPYTPPAGGQIQEGAITYTTSQDANGRLVYHPFRAVPASYQTANGIVTGIQWVPAEATTILPPGAQPANAEFAASWNRGYLSREDEKALKDWQRSEEKRRKKEEKEAAKRMKRLEKERREREYDQDHELRRAREKDSHNLQRRKSFNAGATSPSMPTAYPAGYGGGGGGGGGGGAYGGGYERDRKYSSGAGDLARGMNDLSMGGQGYGDGYSRERKVSTNARPRKYSIGADADPNRRASVNFGTNVYSPTAGPYSSAGVGANSYPSAADPYQPPTSPYAAPGAAPYGGGGHSPYPSSPNMRPGGHSPYPSSPNMRPSDYPAATPGYPATNYQSGPPRSATDPFPRAASPYGGPLSGGAGVYPRGHILEGQPVSSGGSQAAMGQAMARSRATTPNPGYPGGGNGVAFPSAGPSFPQPTVRGVSPMPSPRVGGAQLSGYPASVEPQATIPPGFSRPRNAALAYTPFETMKIQDMEDFEINIPKMPLVLTPHDVYHEDWIRLMSDLALAWTGRLPVDEFARNGRPPKKSTQVADLLERWNSSFFLTRGVEMVLYKGRERRSGPNFGTIDPNVYDSDDSESDTSSSESSDSSDSAVSGEERHRYGEYGLYGRQTASQMTESLQQRRRRRERKAEKKLRRKEKKLRRKAKAKQRRYALYITCVQPREPGYSAGVPPQSLYGGRTSPMPGGGPAYGGSQAGYGGRTSPMPGGAPGYGQAGPQAGYGSSGYPGTPGGGMPGGYGGSGALGMTI